MNHQSTAVQSKRLLGALREAGNTGITTIFARENLDIMMPAARIFELRHNEGYNIQAFPSHDTNAQGNGHSCKRYVLLSGEWQGRGGE